MGQIDLKTKDGKDGMLRLEYSIFDSGHPRDSDWIPFEWCMVYFVTEKEVIYLSARILETLLSSLLTAFIDIPDRKYVSHKGMENCFSVSALEDPLAMILGNQMESGELELVYEGTYGYIIKLMTLTNEDKINWIETIFEKLSGELRGLQYRKGVQISEPFYEFLDTARHEIGNTVYIPGEKTNGQIQNIAWDIKEQRHVYHVKVAEKEYVRRYYEKELRELDWNDGKTGVEKLKKVLADGFSRKRRKKNS